MRRKPTMKPDEQWPEWASRPAHKMVTTSRIFLYLHGFISEAENKRCKERIRKWTMGAVPPGPGRERP